MAEKLPLNRHLIRYVLSNLVSNALKYSPEHTPARVDVQVTESEVTFSISDEGVAIPQEALDRIFRPSSVPITPWHWMVWAWA